ncbi:MAG: prolipoprotein diacylglyceryl transferase [Silvibacterium sp.]|nr:prolipoprotein diacylglyceryl transferase [Silvibacterium sp.]MBV8438539.1 prolipoprotein diacylglyceryl transferase [Silvibacterium sp.]
MYPRLVQFGHVAIPTYGALTALALVAALAAAMHFARRLSLDTNKVWTISITAILTTLVGARLLVVMAHFDAFRQHPFWILGLATLRDGWIAPVSIAVGAAAGVLYALAKGVPVWRVADALAPAAALGFAINRVGAFVAGVDFGTPSSLPCVTYTSRIAALWYRTPAGVPLHPVQLYEAAATLVVFALLIWWIPRRRREGEIAGMALFAFGVASPILSLWRADSARPAFSLAISVVAVLAGAALWLDRGMMPRHYTASDGLPPAR